jgi:alpha-tubulin suppressor-like RCC1 family protein
MKTSNTLILLVLLSYAIAGELFGVGYNEARELGDGSTSSRFNLAPVLGAVEGKDVKMLSSGAAMSAALDPTGKVYSWGIDYRYALGWGVMSITDDGKLYYWGNIGYPKRSIPFLAQGLLTNVHAIQAVASYAVIIALGNNGKVYTWGNSNIVGLV